MGHIGKHSSRVTAEWLEPQVLGEGMESRLRSKVMTLSGKKKRKKALHPKSNETLWEI